MRVDLTAQCCRLCAIAKGERALGAIDQPWLETTNYMAFVSIGALVDGWALVAPKTHSLNLAANYGTAEFEHFLSDAIETVQSAYGKAVVFEHGAQVENSKTSCGTSHAHLHVVPLGFELTGPTIEFDDSLSWKDCSSEEIRTVADGREYLFLSDDYLSDRIGRIALLNEGQSQFFRRVIASKLQRSDEYNYRTHPEAAVALASAHMLRAEAIRRFSVAA